MKTAIQRCRFRMPQSTTRKSSLLGTAALICGLWFAALTCFVLFTGNSADNKYESELIFRLLESPNSLHPEFVDHINTQIRTSERSIVSRWNIRNAVETRQSVRELIPFDGLSNEEIVSFIEENLELRFDDPKEGLVKVTVFATSESDGRDILKSIYDSYVDLMKEEEIRNWRQQIAELEENIEFFERVASDSKMDSTAATKNLAATSRIKDEKACRALKVGFDERVSSIEFQMLDSYSPSPETSAAGLALVFLFIVLLPASIVLVVVFVSRSQSKNTIPEIAAGEPSRPWRWKLSAMQIALPILLATLGALLPFLIASPSWSSNCRLKVVAKSAPGSPPMKSFQNLLELQRREPFKIATLDRLVSRYQWVGTLDQYSDLESEELKPLLSDQLEWEQDELAAGFIDLKFTSDDAAESQTLLLMVVKCFRERYYGSLDVKYMSDPTEAEKNWKFRKVASIFVGILGFIFGFLGACVIGAHRTIMTSQSRISSASSRTEEASSQTEE